MFRVCLGYVLACVLSELVCVGMCVDIVWICVGYVLDMCWHVFCMRWYALVCV